jgi:hypothetical protein
MQAGVFSLSKNKSFFTLKLGDRKLRYLCVELKAAADP